MFTRHKQHELSQQDILAVNFAVGPPVSANDLPGTEICLIHICRLNGVRDCLSRHVCHQFPDMRVIQTEDSLSSRLQVAQEFGVGTLQVGKIAVKMLQMIRFDIGYNFINLLIPEMSHRFHRLRQ